ncbi:phospholipase A1-like [Armigeres subalbatus]|uniref:phospholipase A1-like n=1 Tax=Armigeres subalbatus TaxID=124917 RepID=UPI002ED08129
MMILRNFLKFLLIGLLDAVSLAIPLNETKQHDVDWIQIPTSTWEMIWVHRLAVEAQSRAKWGSSAPDVVFVFFSQTNSAGSAYRLSELDYVDDATFDVLRPTRVVIHGWLNNRNSPLNVKIRQTYLRKWNYNVIVVDWSSCAGSLNYIAAALCVEGVGRMVGKMLWSLKTSKGLTLEDVYVVGHSLGAHVAGISGKTVGSGRLSTIVALDPAWPLISFWDKNSRVDKDDAQYVEVIHTNGGLLGYLEPIGTADFYPNGGVVQPGCGFNFAGICAHSRSWELFVESLEEPEEYLLAKQILSLAELPFLKENTINLAKMGGEPSNRNSEASGLYYMRTSDRSPYFGPSVIDFLE